MNKNVKDLKNFPCGDSKYNFRLPDLAKKFSIAKCLIFTLGTSLKFQNFAKISDGGTCSCMWGAYALHHYWQISYACLHEKFAPEINIHFLLVPSARLKFSFIMNLSNLSVYAPPQMKFALLRLAFYHTK